MTSTVLRVSGCRQTSLLSTLTFAYLGPTSLSPISVTLSSPTRRWLPPCHMWSPTVSYPNSRLANRQKSNRIPVLTTFYVYHKSANPPETNLSVKYLQFHVTRQPCHPDHIILTLSNQPRHPDHVRPTSSDRPRHPDYLRQTLLTFPSTI